MVMGIFDLGRGIYMYNGVSQAAREIARVTERLPGDHRSAEHETVGPVAIQRALVPGMAIPTFECTDRDGRPVRTAHVPRTTTCR